MERKKDEFMEYCLRRIIVVVVGFIKMEWILGFYLTHSHFLTHFLLLMVESSFLYIVAASHTNTHTTRNLDFYIFS